MKRLLLLVILIIFSALETNAARFSNKKNDEFFRSKITDQPPWLMCSIIGYIYTIGSPIITLVIIGTALLAIFGRMPWSALFALGIFTAVFFGAPSILRSIVPSVTYNCETEDYGPSPKPFLYRLVEKKLFSLFW